MKLRSEIWLGKHWLFKDILIEVQKGLGANCIQPKELINPKENITMKEGVRIIAILSMLKKMKKQLHFLQIIHYSQKTKRDDRWIKKMDL